MDETIVPKHRRRKKVAPKPKPRKLNVEIAVKESCSESWEQMAGAMGCSTVGRTGKHRCTRPFQHEGRCGCRCGVVYYIGDTDPYIALDANVVAEWSDG